MYLANLKSVALPVADIGGSHKISATREKYLSGNYVKFEYFPGKYRKIRAFVNLSHIYIFEQKCIPPKLTELLRLCLQSREGRIGVGNGTVRKSVGEFL